MAGSGLVMLFAVKAGNIQYIVCCGKAGKRVIFVTVRQKTLPDLRFASRFRGFHRFILPQGREDTEENPKH